MYNMKQKDSRAVMRMLAEFQENMQKMGRQLTAEEMSLAMQSLEVFDAAMENRLALEAEEEAARVKKRQAPLFLLCKATEGRPALSCIIRK